MFTRENQGLVDSFLRENPQFEPATFANPLTGTPVTGALQIWPWDGDCDAMFVVRLTRKGS